MQADFADDLDRRRLDGRAPAVALQRDRSGASARPQMKTEVVRAGAHRVTTEAMREWALLSWYEARRVRDDPRRLLLPTRRRLGLPAVGQSRSARRRAPTRPSAEGRLDGRR